MTEAIHHLVSVWNPSYSRSAMDDHLAVLLAWARHFDEGNAGDDDLYVWWGKVRLSNRQKPQAHTPEILAAAQLGTEHEVHLYLTDYRSLYVAEVLAVQQGDLPHAELLHAPSYYTEQDLHCDFWFKLGDIRRLVVDDTPLVIEELKKLRNIDDFRAVRNPGTHAAAIDRETAGRWRDRLIGVGCVGDLVELARTGPR